MLLGCAVVSAAQTVSAPRVRVASIASVSADDATIVLQSESALPRPVIGVLDDPARIYFDFAGFRPAASMTAAPDESIVRGVRIALHSVEPLLTRVVIDLRQRTRYRLDASAAGSGRLVIVVGGSPEPAPAPRTSSSAQSTPPSANSAQRLAAVLRQLDTLTPILTTIDARGETPTIGLQAAAAQIDSMEDALHALRPAPALQPARDRLAQACALARQAVKARFESAARGNAALNWNAASAAAGALLLLDRAREDLALPARSR